VNLVDVGVDVVLVVIFRQLASGSVVHLEVAEVSYPVPVVLVPRVDQDLTTVLSVPEI